LTGATTHVYIQHGAQSVTGMSSHMSTVIIGRLLAYQQEHDLGGALLEIGAYEGRMLILFALAGQGNETVLGIDTFDWPGTGVTGIKQRLIANMDKWAGGRKVVIHEGDSTAISPAELSRLLGGQAVRLAHLDGDHTVDALRTDLHNTAENLAPHGLICIDDMLHPEFPFLTSVVQTFLDDRPDFRLLCIIDRVGFVGAVKFVVCRRDHVDAYREDLDHHFALWRYPHGVKHPHEPSLFTIA
jgi:hypothetical protein